MASDEMLPRQRKVMGRMERELELLRDSKLFAGIGADKLRKMLVCLGTRRASFVPGDTVVREGEELREVGIVLSGHARSLKTDGSGHPLLLSLLERGSYIGILLAASRDRKSPVTVQAQDPLTVLFFPAEKLAFPCEKRCPEHGGLTRNFLDSVAERSLALNDRIGCLIRRSVREKVLAYLTCVSEEQHSREFTVPLDRSAMADYLNIERSALSRELSRMRQDGLIQYRKNFFRLL